MKTHIIHPVSALAGATIILGACLLSGMRSPRGVSNEKQEILRHMSIVYLPDGLGGTAKTIRFTGVNVQVVNGLKSTNGNGAYVHKDLTVSLVPAGAPVPVETDIQ